MTPPPTVTVPANPAQTRRAAIVPGVRLGLAAAAVLFSAGETLSQTLVPPASNPPASPSPGSPPAPPPPEASRSQPTTQPGVPGTPGAQPTPTPPTADAISAFEGRPIREVRLSGLKEVSEQLVQNQVRSKSGTPLAAELVRKDIQRLNRLGRFKEIDVKVQPLADQSVILSFDFTEAKLIKDVQSVGNRQISDQDIARELPPLAGTPVDEFELGRATVRIQELYRKKGYYLAEVSVDREELEKTGNVLFRIRERERINVTDIRFKGNQNFSADQIFPVIKTKTANIFETGPLDDEVLDNDTTAVINFYKDRGYLDVRADREVRPSPDSKEAIVTFLIDEGRLYTLRSIRAELDDGSGRPSGQSPVVFPSVAQLSGIMLIKPGDAYSVDKIEKSVRAISDAYGKLGYVESRVDRRELRDPDSPQVDLLLLITEGRAYKVGLVTIRGNDLTQQKVIRRQVRVKPQRPADATLLRDSKEAIDGTRLFEGAAVPGGPPTSVRLTFQPPESPESDERDVLVEVRETNTGSLGFGIGVSSDSGLVGSVNLSQRNFDIADFPESLDEFINGRAFRGAGQVFNLTIAPGTETQTYGLSLADPNLFETNISGTIGAQYYTREYDQYDEQRLGGSVNIGRRFGDRWSGVITMRASNVELNNIDFDAPVDVYESAGPDTLTGLGLRVSRTTADRNTRPTRGTKIDLAAEQVGALGGDLNFTKLFAEYFLYVPLREDSLGRFTVLSMRCAAAWIPQGEDDVPVYERYYLGGRSLRGFEYRTVSPKGYRNDNGQLGDDPVGGTWSFFAGAELEQPIWEQILSGVIFVDSGTVTNDPGFSSYRLSVGVGLRISVPQLGPVPLAFDFGFPIFKEDGDEEQFFSFSLDVPF